MSLGLEYEGKHYDAEAGAVEVDLELLTSFTRYRGQHLADR